MNLALAVLCALLGVVVLIVWLWWDAQLRRDIREIERKLGAGRCDWEEDR